MSAPSHAPASGGSSSGGSNMIGECFFGYCEETKGAAHNLAGMFSNTFLGIFGGDDNGHHHH